MTMLLYEHSHIECVSFVEVSELKANKEKMELALARACMNTADLVCMTAKPEPTVKKVLSGRNVRPVTLGRIAKALGVDPAELISTEEA